MKFNPFSNGIKPEYYYGGFGFFNCMSILNGSMSRLGIFDYVLIIPMLAKLLHSKIQSGFTEALVHIISIPKNILAFISAIVLIPVIAIINVKFFSPEYKKELNKINNLDVSIKVKNTDGSSTERISTKLSQVFTDYAKNSSGNWKPEKPENKYMIEYSAKEYSETETRNSNPRIKLYPANACYCSPFAAKPHEPSRSKDKKIPVITIPFTEENKEGIESIFKVGAFFSEELSDFGHDAPIREKLKTL